MNIRPEEKEIVGSWVLLDGRMVEDETSKRIGLLVASQLEQVAITRDGWEKLYRDPRDGRYWELFYPRGYMQGGGPPALRFVDSETAKQKYQFAK